MFIRTCFVSFLFVLFVQLGIISLVDSLTDHYFIVLFLYVKLFFQRRKLSLYDYFC